MPPRTSAIQNLTSDILIGSATITVADTSVFLDNEFVLIKDSDSVAFLARIESIDSLTQITLDRNVDKNYTVVQSALITSVFQAVCVIQSIFQEGNKWISIGTGYCYDREYIGFATADNFEGPYTHDIDRGLLLEPDPLSEWDNTSLENGVLYPMQYNPLTYIPFTHTINEIIILKEGEVLTTVEDNALRDYCGLSVYWDNILNIHGNIKLNRQEMKALWIPEYYYESESNALFARMIIGGDHPTNERKTIINTAIAALKTAGIWSKLDCLYLMAAFKKTSAVLNWISTSYNLVEEDNPEFTSDRGYTGDGIYAHLKTNYDPNAETLKYGLIDACIGVYIRAWIAQTKKVFGSYRDPNVGNTTIFPRYTDDNMYFAFHGGVDLSPSSIVITDGTGLLTFVQDSATTAKIYKNKVKTDLVNTAIALPGEFYILTGNAAGVIEVSSTGEVCLFFAGSKLTPTEQGLLYDILVDGYLTSVEAKI